MHGRDSRCDPQEARTSGRPSGVSYTFSNLQEGAVTQDAVL